MVQEFRLTLPNRSESLIKIEDFILEIGNKSKLDEDKLHDVLLAVDEACTNIIRYAFEEMEESNFTIICKINTKKITICLINQGKRFDPTSLLDKTPSRSVIDLDYLIKQGRGLFFMHHFMDKLKYKYHPQKGNILWMIKYKKKGGDKENGFKG